MQKRNHNRHHAPVKPGNQSPTLETRMGRRVTPLPSGCWAFDGDLTKYHKVNLPKTGDGDLGRSSQAHRWFYETLVGPIEDDHDLHHRCENPGCVNPAHMEPMTTADHMAEHARRRKAG